MWAWRSTGAARNIAAGALLAVIMVATGRCTRWERWLPGSGGGLKVLNWNLHSFQLLEIIQVLDSISWVRCASGNVFYVATKPF